MTEHEFAKRENWFGSSYELGIAYTSGQQCIAALQALWQNPLLEEKVTGAQTPVGAPVAMPPVFEQLSCPYGRLHLPDRRAVGCYSDIMDAATDGNEEGTTRRTCWLLLCVPTGMLELVYPVNYLITRDTNPWIDEFERILIGIAESVYRLVPFDLAIIGEQAADISQVEQSLTSADLDRGGYLIAPRLAHHLQPARVPMVCPTGLLWFPWTW